jgi:hypothetical protein
MTEPAATDHEGVEGNARMTAMLGAVLLIALAVEGVTLIDVRQLFTLHVFIGLFVIPVVCLKLATTGYRFYHYYRGTAAYRRKGPPHPILRIAAPLIGLATVVLLGSGVVMLVIGPSRSDTWLTIHQGSFIAWVTLTTVHVLGHIIETWKLTTAEMRAAPAMPRRAVRVALVAGSITVGLALGVASLGWTGDWKNQRGQRGETVPTVVLADRGVVPTLSPEPNHAESGSRRQSSERRA